MKPKYKKRKSYLFMPVGIYVVKVNNRNTRTRCEMCSKLTVKTQEQCLESFWCVYC